MRQTPLSMFAALCSGPYTDSFTTSSLQRGLKLCKGITRSERRRCDYTKSSAQAWCLGCSTPPIRFGSEYVSDKHSVYDTPLGPRAVLEGQLLVHVGQVLMH